MTKAAILVDGGYFLKRLPIVRKDVDITDVDAVAQAVLQLIQGHLSQLNKVECVPNMYRLLYRSFYYDARPYNQKGHTPISRTAINYATSREATFRTRLFDILHSCPNLAVRLGDVRKDSDRSWIIKAGAQRQMLTGALSVNDLTDDDYSPAFRQKGVDMRIGLDIASITLKRQANVIILVAGDADFIPAAKLSRREGARFILDPLWQNVPRELLEHIDGLRSGFHNPHRE